MLSAQEVFAVIMDSYFDNDYSWENIEKAYSLIEKEAYTI